MSRGEGPRNAVSMWIGLGPNDDDARSGRVWGGNAGRLLNNLLWRENIDRRDIYITNLRSTQVVKGDGGPLKEIDDLEFELMRVDPQVLVTMGREATQWALGDVDMEAVHGIPWHSDYGKVVVPIYNPAYALHEAEAFAAVSHDVHQVRRVLDGEVSPRFVHDVHPQPSYSLGFKKYPHKSVYVDTEGWPDRPWCLSYCCVPGVAHVILATDKEGLAQFRRWLQGRDRVVLHSAMWDLAVLRAMGITVDDDQLNDTKVMVYVAGQIDPPGLKPLGFRHACMRMKDYADVTGPYDFMQALRYLERVAETDWGKPDPILERVDGKHKVKQPQGLNTRLKSIFTAIAKAADLEEDETPYTLPRKRWLKIDPDTRRPAEDALGPMPEFTLDLLPTKEAVEYAGRDADATCRVEAPLWDQVVEGGHEETYRTDIEALPIVERMQSNGLLVQPGYFPKLSAYFQSEMDRIRKQIESYNGGNYINPGSSPQTAALLFNRLRLPVLKVTKGSKKGGPRVPSTADKVLEALRGKHKCVGLLCDWRELANLKDKFCEKLPAHISVHDGRVRGTIRDTTVVSGRYSMSNPNLMAIPTRSAVGKRIREGFVAGPGNLLGSADFDQVEMRVMADESGDEAMINAFLHGHDIHAENAALIFGVTVAECKTPEGKLLYRYPAKRIGFGIITGITGLGLYDQMKLAGIDKYSAQDCQEMIDNYFKVRPAVAGFLRWCRSEVERNGYIRTKDGRIRYLPGVYSNNPGVREEALRQSHSHRISGRAQWIKKRALKRIWDQIKDLPRGEIEPLVEIHDEVVFEFKKEREKQVEQLLLSCMSADSDQFKVPITANFGSGPNWGSLKD